MIVGELFESLTKCATDLTIEVLNNFSSYKPLKQDETKATHCNKVVKKNGLVSFKNAREVYNKYRAYTPWPGIYLESGLKLKQITLEDEISQNQEGIILKIDDNYIVVGCLVGSLKILKVQPQSKKEMDILSYINGKRLSIEDYLS